MLSMYRAIERLVIVDVVLSSLVTWESEAGRLHQYHVLS